MCNLKNENVPAENFILVEAVRNSEKKKAHVMIILSERTNCSLLVDGKFDDKNDIIFAHTSHVSPYVLARCCTVDLWNSTTCLLNSP
jgi:hypothetical protein